MSGGGRCNVLPSEIDPARFVTASSPNTLKKLLLAWPLREQRRFFEEDLAIPLALEEETGKLFPVSNKAKDVRDRLRAMAERNGVEMRFDTSVTGLEPAGRNATGGSARAATSWRVKLAQRQRPPRLARHHRDRWAFDARDRKRRHRDRHRAEPWPHDPRHVSRADPAHRVTAQVRVALGRFASGHARGAGPGPTGARSANSPPAADSSSPTKATAAPRCSTSRTSPRSRSAAGGPPQEIYARWTERDANAWDRALREGEGTVLTALRRATSRHASRKRSSMTLASMARSRCRSSPARTRLRVVEALTHHRLPWNGDEGLQAGRGHGRWRGARRNRPPHPRKSAPPRALPLRGNPRRVRPHRRIQLRLGLVHGARGGNGGAPAIEAPKIPASRTLRPPRESE